MVEIPSRITFCPQGERVLYGRDLCRWDLKDRLAANTESEKLPPAAAGVRVVRHFARDRLWRCQIGLQQVLSVVIGCPHRTGPGLSSVLAEPSILMTI